MTETQTTQTEEAAENGDTETQEVIRVGENAWSREEVTDALTERMKDDFEFYRVDGGRYIHATVKVNAVSNISPDIEGADRFKLNCRHSPAVRFVARPEQLGLEVQE